MDERNFTQPPSPFKGWRLTKAEAIRVAIKDRLEDMRYIFEEVEDLKIALEKEEKAEKSPKKAKKKGPKSRAKNPWWKS